MILSYKDVSLFVNSNYFSSSKTTILFLHGFSGSSSDWDEIISQLDTSYSYLSLDLIGHGKSSSPEDVSFYKTDSITEQIEQIVDKLKIDKLIIAGYSMGGRVALNFALRFPRRIKGLILESTTAGIENKEERESRLKNDEFLADLISQNGIDEFVNYWLKLPIFSSQENLSYLKKNKIKENKLFNNPVGLINSLKGFGTGKMKPIWECISQFYFPILLLSGELDQKYCGINKRISEIIPNSKLEIVKNAGHNIHLEKPSEFVILVNRFLKTNFT